MTQATLRDKMRHIVFDLDIPLTQHHGQLIAESFTDEDISEFFEHHPFEAMECFKRYPDRIKPAQIALLVDLYPFLALRYYSDFLTAEQVAKFVKEHPEWCARLLKHRLTSEQLEVLVEKGHSHLLFE